MLNLQGAGVLVTGGCGFLGSHLVEQLHAAGAQVTVVDNGSTGDQQNLAAVREEISLLKLDVRSPAFGAWLGANSFDAVFHLASTAYVPPSIDDPYFDFDNNAHGTIKLLEAMRCSDNGKSVFIVASSAAVYGDPMTLPIDEQAPLDPISPYGISKLTMERYVATYARHYGLRAASLRLFSAYGPRQRKQVVYDFIRKLARRPEALEILGDGRQERDLVFAEDVARAALEVSRSGKLEGEVYNVATGVSCTTLDLAHKVAAAMDLDPRLEYTGKVRAGDPDRWQADISRLQALGFQPAVDLDEGVRRTVAWFRETDSDRRAG